MPIENNLIEFFRCCWLNFRKKAKIIIYILFLILHNWTSLHKWLPSCWPLCVEWSTHHDRCWYENKAKMMNMSTSIFDGTNLARIVELVLLGQQFKNAFLLLNRMCYSKVGHWLEMLQEYRLYSIEFRTHYALEEMHMQTLHCKEISLYMFLLIV